MLLQDVRSTFLPIVKKFAVITVFLLPTLCLGQTDLKEKVKSSLEKGTIFFHSINVHGGYVYYVTPDLSKRWGEVPVDAHTIEVQPPGTPAVGQSFLKVYQVIGDENALNAARDAANALVRGQNQNGGWNHTIHFNDLSDHTVSFDDNQSQSAVSFLMELDQVVDDPPISAGVDRAIDMMVNTQLKNGGWPHKYPKQGNYHDFATFNDGGINDCIRVMIEASNYYPDDLATKESLRKAARFMTISQLPPPQPGWAQQYNEFLQPAWARTFEPPSVCPSVTIKNINTLIDLYLAFDDKTLLDPIPDALRWLREIQMENGNWARFVELGTNKALYYDRGRIRVDNMEDLHPERRTGYAYQTNLESQLEETKIRFNKAVELGSDELRKKEHQNSVPGELQKRLEAMYETVEEILESQAPSGAWITVDDRFKRTMPRGVRWNGEYDEMDRISSSVFNRNVAVLCEYLELCEQLDGR